MNERLFVLTHFLILFWILANFLNLCHGTGMTTQVRVALRAQEYFDGNVTGDLDYNQILYGHHDALFAGAIFPEAFQQCAGARYSYISDDTHYGGFLNASINYIRNHYPQPWSKDTEKLVAFVMGVASKQVSTMLWESIGVSDGFTRVLANVNFHGSYKDAQKSANFGADAVILFKSVLNYIGFDQQWYFPVEDLFKIYQEYYGTVKISADVIDNCTTLHVLETLAELALTSKSYHEVADVSPFLVDQTKDYFLGGLNDMAKWTQIVWTNTILMLQNGTQLCDIPRNSLYINCKKEEETKQPPTSYRKLSDTVREQSVLASTGVTMDDVIVTQLKHGKTVQGTGKLQRILENGEKTETKKQKHQYSQIKQYLYYSNHSSSQFSWSMAVGDIDGDGNEDLVAGAPGYSEKGDFQFGRVYIMYSNDDGITRNQSYLWELVEENRPFTSYFSGQSKANSRYGSSVALVDINLDGALDLAVGAPSFSNSGSLGYNGIVYVYFGQPKARLVQHNPDITITCQITNCNLGFSMTVVDFNQDGHDDLILGTPFYSKELNQSGIVSALPSSSSYTGLKTFAFEDLITNFSLPSKQEYSWFGYSMSAKHDVLLVKQPYFRRCGRQDCRLSQNDTQAAGAVDVYNFGTKVKCQNFTSFGEYEFYMAGAGADIGFPYNDSKLIFAIGMHGTSVYGNILGIPIHFRQGGTVLLFDISESPRFVANFDGNRMYERFGKYVLFDDVNGDGIDDLVFSASERTEELIPPLEERMKISGTVYTFFGGDGFPVGNITHSESRCDGFIPCPESIANITTSNPSEDSEYGDVLKVMKDKTSNSLVTSSLRWHYRYYYLSSGFTTITFNHSHTDHHP